MEKTFNYLFNDYYDSIVSEVRGSKFQLFDAKKTKLSVVEKMQPATISTRFHNFNL